MRSLAALRPVFVACLALALATMALVPSASARLIDSGRMRNIFPLVEPGGAVRKADRFVRLNARVSAPVKVKADLIVTCVPDVGRSRTRRKRVGRIARLRIHIRTPWFPGAHCYASAVVGALGSAPVVLRAGVHGTRH
jgi:hypothetical protein